MSMKINGKVGGFLPRPQELTDPSRVQAPTPTESELPDLSALVTEALATSVDCFEQPSRARQEWAANFSGVASAPSATLQAVKTLSNVLNEQYNVVSDTQRQRAGWASDAPVLQQNGDTDCGEAVVTMLKGAKKGQEQVAAQQSMSELKSRYGSVEGTRPTQMGDMLASERLEVKKSTTTLDKAALDGALHSGDKAAVMVDSNRIAGGTELPPGKAHWVLVDGMDDQGRYMVKDPGNGASYFVKTEELSDAIKTGRDTHQSGGMLIVGNADSKPEAELAEKNKKTAEALGQIPGTGSNTRRFGRESS
jgi:hypothetical protein